MEKPTRKRSVQPTEYAVRKALHDLKVRHYEEYRALYAWHIAQVGGQARDQGLVALAPDEIGRPPAAK